MFIFLPNIVPNHAYCPLWPHMAFPNGTLSPTIRSLIISIFFNTNEDLPVLLNFSPLAKDSQGQSRPHAGEILARKNAGIYLAA